MPHYGTIAGAEAYHLARGNTAWADGSVEARTAALVRASDYIDGRYRYQTAGGCWLSMFRGEKTGGRAQQREWPRTDATDSYGNAIPDDEVPDEVVRATYEGALLELLNPGSLSPVFVPSQLVTREKVGPVEIGYSDPGKSDQPPNRPVVPIIDDILAALICDRPIFGVGVRVV